MKVGSILYLYLKPNCPGAWHRANCTINNVLIPRLRNRQLKEIRQADVVKVLGDYSNRPARRKKIHSLL